MPPIKSLFTVDKVNLPLAAVIVVLAICEGRVSVLSKAKGRKTHQASAGNLIQCRNSRYSQDFKQPETAGEFFARMKREEQAHIHTRQTLKAVEQQERMRFAAQYIGIGMGIMGIVAIILFILLR